MPALSKDSKSKAEWRNETEGKKGGSNMESKMRRIDGSYARELAPTVKGSQDQRDAEAPRATARRDDKKGRDKDDKKDRDTGKRQRDAEASQATARKDVKKEHDAKSSHRDAEAPRATARSKDGKQERDAKSSHRDAEAPRATARSKEGKDVKRDTHGKAGNVTKEDDEQAMRSRSMTGMSSQRARKNRQRLNKKVLPAEAGQARSSQEPAPRAQMDGQSRSWPAERAATGQQTAAKSRPRRPRSPSSDNETVARDLAADALRRAVNQMDNTAAVTARAAQLLGRMRFSKERRRQ